LNILSLLLILNSLVLIGLAIYGLRQRPATGTGFFALIMVAAATWAVGYGLEMTTDVLETARLWTCFQYVGIATLPVFWLLFILSYVRPGREVPPLWCLLLLVVPVGIIAAVNTNPLHLLYYREYRMIATGPLHLQAVTPGPLYWVHVVYSYLASLVGLGLLLAWMLRVRGVYRRQGWLLLAGVLAPLVTSMTYVAGLKPFGHLDTTPFAFTLTGLLIIWATYRHHLLDLMPIARDVLVENLTDCVLVLDARQRLVDLNLAAQQQLGVDRVALLGQTLTPAIPWLQPLADDCRDCQPEFRELEVSSPSGAVYEARCNSLRSVHGTQLGSLVVLRDITGRKRGEAIRRAHRDILQAIVLTAQTFLHGKVGRQNFEVVLQQLGEAAGASRAYLFENHLGPKGELAASQRFEWVAEGIRPEINNPALQNMVYRQVGLERWEQELGSGRSLHGFVRDLLATERAILEPQDIQALVVAPIFTDQGWWGFLGVDECRQERQWSEVEVAALELAAQLLGAGLQRQHMEQSLRESEERYRTFIDAHDDLAYVKDEQFRYLLVNRPTAEFFGRPEGDIVGRTDFELMPEELAQNCRRSDEHALAAGTAVIAYEQVGDRIYESRKFPVPLAGGRMGVGAYIRDVTDLRRAEDSARLATVGQLAAGVAHEFNNLLASMMMRAERAQMRSSVEDYEKLTDLVLRQTTRGAELCRSLSAFARPQTPRREMVRLETSLEAALAMAAHQIEATGVQVQLSEGTGQALVLADSGQLEQVFLNLFINACHAMPTGGQLTLITEYHPAERGPGTVVARITDTGIGISPENLGRIFEPFFTTKGRLGESEVPGTGLGLVVSHGIVTAHGGQIKVYSTVGTGTTFELTFPAASAQPAVARRPERPEPEMKKETDHQQWRILLAEDEESLRDTVVLILEEFGHTVCAVGDATAAGERLAQERFDLVITDLMMPGGGGRVVMEAVNELAQHPAVLVITGRAEQGVLERLTDLGARGFLPKPFGAQELLDAIEEVMGG
jgi:PAS domain S-box-containing protein